MQSGPKRKQCPKILAITLPRLATWVSPLAFTSGRSFARSLANQFVSRALLIPNLPTISFLKFLFTLNSFFLTFCTFINHNFVIFCRIWHNYETWWDKWGKLGSWNLYRYDKAHNCRSVRLEPSQVELLAKWVSIEAKSGEEFVEARL